MSTDIVERLRWDTRYTNGHVPVTLADAADEIERLRAMVGELADDMASEIEGHYEGLKDHPSMKRRYDRDMEIVRRARALLGANASEAINRQSK